MYIWDVIGYKLRKLRHFTRLWTLKMQPHTNSHYSTTSLAEVKNKLGCEMYLLFSFSPKTMTQKRLQCCTTCCFVSRNCAPSASVPCSGDSLICTIMPSEPLCSCSPFCTGLVKKNDYYVSRYCSINDCVLGCQRQEKEVMTIAGGSTDSRMCIQWL